MLSSEEIEGSLPVLIADLWTWCSSATAWEMPLVHNLAPALFMAAAFIAFIGFLAIIADLSIWCSSTTAWEMPLLDNLAPAFKMPAVFIAFIAVLAFIAFVDFMARAAGSGNRAEAGRRWTHRRRKAGSERRPR